MLPPQQPCRTRHDSNVSKAPLSRAKTIARTEGHRIQQAATYDAQKYAKSKGSDVVKQWDSTLDGATRDTHRLLDGQIREIDEPFEANGKKAMFPGDFGDPAEDCNCLCISKTRAVAALDADELARMKERAEYFGLDKTKEFEQFEKSYMKASAMKELVKFAPADSIDGARNYARDKLGLEQTTAYGMGMNVDVANGLNEAIYNIGGTFKSLTESGYLDNVLINTGKSGAYAAYSPGLRTILLNKSCTRKNAVQKMRKDAVEEYSAGAWSTGSPFHSIY